MLLLAACCYAVLTTGFSSAMNSFWLSSIAAELVMDKAEQGLFLSASFWGPLVACVTIGILADRFGYRRFVALGVCCQVAGMFAISAAPSFGWVVVGASLVSVGSGCLVVLVFPIAFALYTQLRNAVSNLLVSFSPLGSIAASFLGIVLLGQEWTWRGTYRLAALLPLPVLVAFLVLPLTSGAGPTSEPAQGAAAKTTGLARLLRSLPFALLLAGAVLFGFVAVGVGAWIPNYLETVTGASTRFAGVGMIAACVSSAAGTWFNAALSKLVGPRQLCVVGGLIGAAALGAAALSVDPWVVIVLLCVMMFTIAGMGPAFVANAGDRFPTAGAALYSALTLASALGCSAGSLALGALAEDWGLRHAVGAMAVVPVVLLVLLLILLPPKQRATDSAG